MIVDSRGGRISGKSINLMLIGIASNKTRGGCCRS